MPKTSSRPHRFDVGFVCVCLSLVVVCLFAFCFAQPVRGTVLVTGDILPTTDPNTWTPDTSVCIGETNSGTLSITGSSNIINGDGCLGWYSGSTGKVIVNGPGSSWTNDFSLKVGYHGRGILDINNSGTVINNGPCSVGCRSGSSGIVTVDGEGSTWTIDNDYDLRIGYQGSGILNITGGGAVLVKESICILGASSNSTGSVTVDGASSILTLEDSMYVGRHGSGTLNIINGGSVNVEGFTRVAFEAGSSGAIHLENGTLTTDSLACARDDLTGTGTINTHGLVSDVDLVFNSTYGLNQIINLSDNLGQDITINLTVDGSGSMGAGYSGDGSMSISNGRVVESKYGFIGYKSGSSGIVSVDGVGSMWANSTGLEVGRSGSGILNITGGGIVVNSEQDVRIGSMGEVAVNGDGSTLTNSYSLSVDGTLNVSDGGTIHNGTGCIGYRSGTLGKATVDGAGSTWNNSGGLGVHSGTLNITNGGAISTGSASIGYTSASTAVVTVDGTGSTWTNAGDFSVGGGSDGTLNITNGGVVSCCGSAYIGSPHGSIGDVTIDGIGSSWTNSDYLCVHNGTLNITNGGFISNDTCLIGNFHQTTANCTINVIGATWTNSDRLCIIDGKLNITDGGVVSSKRGFIGYDSPSAAICEVTVDGTDSTWANSDDLEFTALNSSMNIINGGAVTVGGNTWVSSYYYTHGKIHFDNGTLTTKGLACSDDALTGTGTINTHGLICDVDLIFNATYGLNQILNLAGKPDQNITINLAVDGSGAMGAGYGGFGTMNISDGRVVESSEGYIGYKSGSFGTVTVTGTGSAWKNNGTLSVGYNGNGTLNITEDGLVSVAGALISGSSYWDDGDGFINMATGGMLALFGDADDSLDEFLRLSASGDAVIRFWDDSIADWADITGATYGEDYLLSYMVGGILDGYTVLTVGLPETDIAGDADCNGVVDEADARMMTTYWLTTSGATWAMGDFNGDGAVNGIDATLLAANWQGGAWQGVPEPSGILGLLWLCLVGALFRTRQKS